MMRACAVGLLAMVLGTIGCGLPTEVIIPDGFAERGNRGQVLNYQ